LHVAARSGRVKAVKQLLEQGAKVNIKDNDGWQPLHEACNHGHAEVASLLITHGADINNNENNEEHITPLHDAASNGHIHVVKLLINSGASLHIKSGNGETVLQSLQEYIRVREHSTGSKPSGFLESCEQLEALIVSKMKREVTNDLVNDNKQATTSDKGNVNVEPILEQQDVIIIIDSPLKYENNQDISSNMVEPLSEQKDLITIINSASKNEKEAPTNNVEAKTKNEKEDPTNNVEARLQQNEANKRNKLGKSELHIAAKSGQLKKAKILLEQGAEVNIPDEYGWQPLHEACKHGHAVVASLLITHGADINNNENDEHITPLHDAASNGHLYIVKLLVNNKASLHIKSANGETALESLQELIRGEELSNKKPTGFLEARKRVEAFILSKMETEDNEQITTSEKEQTNVEPYVEQNDVIIILDSPSKNETDPILLTNNVESRPEKKISFSIDSQSFSNDTPYQSDIDDHIEKLVNESSLKGKTIAKEESLLKVNTPKENNHNSEGLSNTDIEMFHNSAVTTSKESKVSTLANKKINNNRKNNSYDKNDVNICNWNYSKDTKVGSSQHLEAVISDENAYSSVYNNNKNDVIVLSNKNITSHSKIDTASTSTNLHKSIQDKTATNGTNSMFSKDILNNTLLKSDDELVPNKLNHNEHSNTDSVLRINIHEQDQFMLIPFHNKNEMSPAGWLIDKNKTCIELVRRKVGSPLSPLRPEHNKVIQLNKKFDIFEQKHQPVTTNQSVTANDEAGPSKSNSQQDFMSMMEVLQKRSDSPSLSEASSIIKSRKTSTVPNLSPPRKTSKTTTPKITLSTPLAKKSIKNSFYQQPTKRGSVKSIKKKKQIEDQNQRRIDNWFMKSEPKEAKSTTSTDIR